MKDNKQYTQEAATLDEKQVYSFLELNDTSKCSTVKNENNCMVLQTQNCVYKVRKQDISDPINHFYQIVLNAFVSECKQMGLEWDIFTVEDNASFYTVEKRPILKVATAVDFNSFDDVLACTRGFYRRVENQLEFPSLIAQMRQNECFDMIEKVYLARDCKNDFADYALWQEHVIPLGNSKFFLALIDAGGVWDMRHRPKAFKISLSYMDGCYLDDLRLFRKSALDLCLNCASKWWLYPSSIGNLTKVKKDLDRELKDMYSTNLKILTSKQLIPVKARNNSGDGMSNERNK